MWSSLFLRSFFSLIIFMLLFFSSFAGAFFSVSFFFFFIFFLSFHFLTKWCVHSPSVSSLESSFLNFSVLSFTIPNYISVVFCSLLPFCPYLTSATHFFFLMPLCACVYVWVLPISPYTHMFSHSHAVYAQICISSALPSCFMQILTTYRTFPRYVVFMESLSLSFPIWGVMGIQLQDSAYCLCYSLSVSWIKSF